MGGFLRKLFGPSRDEVWAEFSRQIGGDFLPSQWFEQARVQAGAGDNTITLDTYTVSTGKSSVTYTRIRAPFVNTDGLRFELYRAGLFTPLGKLLGMQDIQIGNVAFDEQMVVKSNSEERIRELLNDPRLLAEICRHPNFYLTVQDDRGWFNATFPDGVDELHFVIGGVLTDLDRLKSLFEVFSLLLHRLKHLDAAYETDLDLLLYELNAPGGKIAERDVVQWDGDAPRRRAAAALAAHQDPSAVAALRTHLSDPNPVVRVACALSYLQLTGDDGLPEIIPLLADLAPVDGRPVWAIVQTACTSPLAEAVTGIADRIRQGGRVQRADLDRGHEADWRRFLAELAGSDSLYTAAVDLAVELAAVECVEPFRKLLRAAAPEMRTQLRQGIEALERVQSLPLPASTAPESVSGLPVPGASSPDSAE